MFHFVRGERELSESLGSTALQVMDSVQSRFDPVGGLVRYVLCSATMYRQRLIDQQAVLANELFDNFYRNRLFSTTREAKYFFAPFVKNYVDVPTSDSKCWSWQFLSHQRALAAAIFHLFV